MKTIEKCSGCGQLIPDTEVSCPNCGRKRKGPLPDAAVAAQKSKIAKPIVAQFCTGLAWLAIIPGGILLISGIGDSFSRHPSAAGEFAAGIALVCSAMLWFLGARGITLLAQIERNTRATSAS